MACYVIFPEILLVLVPISAQLNICQVFGLKNNALSQSAKHPPYFQTSVTSVKASKKLPKLICISNIKHKTNLCYWIFKFFNRFFIKKKLQSNTFSKWCMTLKQFVLAIIIILDSMGDGCVPWRPLLLLKPRAMNVNKLHHTIPYPSPGICSSSWPVQLKVIYILNSSIPEVKDQMWSFSCCNREKVKKQLQNIQPRN